MADLTDMDTDLGVFRWSWRRLPHHVASVIGVVVVILLGAFAGTIVHMPTNPTARDRLIGAGLAATITLGGVIAIGFLYAVVIAPYEQRKVLREKRQTLEGQLEYPHRPTQAALDELGQLYKAGDYRMLSFEATASGLPLWTREWMVSTDPAEAEAYREARKRVDRDAEPLSEWTTECDKAVARLLGENQAVLMISWHTLDVPQPDYLNGWGDFEWSAAKSRLAWLRETMEGIRGY